jgi:hypothetical protein
MIFTVRVPVYCFDGLIRCEMCNYNLKLEIEFKNLGENIWILNCNAYFWWYAVHPGVPVCHKALQFILGYFYDVKFDNHCVLLLKISNVEEDFKVDVPFY